MVRQRSSTDRRASIPLRTQDAVISLLETGIDKHSDADGHGSFEPEPAGDLITGEERANLASAYVCHSCFERGIKVSTWTDFNAWAQYVAGHIDEPQLTEEARRELESYSDMYGKYLLLDRENPPLSIDDTEKRVRAKRAGRIYRTACRNAGLTICFFNNFSAWSDYVQGKLEEAEFKRKVEEEIELYPKVDA